MQTDPESFSPMICQTNGARTFFVYYFNCLFLRLIITCRLWVIYVRRIIIPMYRLWLHGLYGLYGPMSSVPKKGYKLNLSLSGINLYMCECIWKVNFELLIMNPQDPMSNYILCHSGYCFALTRLMMPLLSMYLPFIGLINWWLLILSFGWYSWKKNRWQFSLGGKDHNVCCHNIELLQLQYI